MNRSRVYTAFLIQELPYSLFNPNRPENRRYITEPLPGEWEAASKKANSITDKARLQPGFKYPEGGSVFMDYKILRDNQVEVGEMEMVAQRFREESTLREIFTTATQIIAEWKTTAARGERRG